MFPDDYKDIDFSAVQSQVHKLALRALIETELRPCEINRRLGITDKTLLYRLGWKHFGKSFFTDRTSCLSRRAQERALGEIKARAESEKAGPGERCSDSDPVVIVPAPTAGPTAAPQRPHLPHAPASHRTRPSSSCTPPPFKWGISNTITLNFIEMLG